MENLHKIFGNASCLVTYEKYIKTEIGAIYQQLITTGRSNMHDVCDTLKYF
jgi:hypothetical protein